MITFAASFTGCPDGGIGRRAGLKHQWIHFHAGSTPALGTWLYKMELRKKTFILLALSIVWAVFIFICCTLPPSAIPKFNIPHLDKAAHFGFFYVQSVLLSLLFHLNTRKNYFQIIFLSTFLVFVYGGIIEIVQSEFFNRAGEYQDVLADVLGGLSGALTCPAILKLFKKKESR